MYAIWHRSYVKRKEYSYRRAARSHYRPQQYSRETRRTVAAERKCYCNVLSFPYEKLERNDQSSRYFNSRNGKNACSRRSEEHTSELQSRFDLVCRLLLEKKNKQNEQ